MTAIINLPSRLNLLTIDNIIQAAIGQNLKPLHKKVTYNFSSLGFIDSTGITVFSNLIEWLRMHGVEQAFSGTNIQNQSIKFLDDSLFFERYLKRKLSVTSTPRSTTIPLKLIRHVESYGWIENNCVDWLSRRLTLAKKSLVEIKLCLQELFNNIKDHSSVDTGCIFVQHHPNINKIKISLSDFGIGIPANIRKVHPELTDGPAILKALEEGFTTKTTNRNRGVGLHLLAQTVVRNGGTLSIRSAGGHVFCSAAGFNDYSTGKHYPGTVLEIELDTNNFDSTLADEEEFVW